jgi:hypothetical protein
VLSPEISSLEPFLVRCTKFMTPLSLAAQTGMVSEIQGPGRTESRTSLLTDSPPV